MRASVALLLAGGCAEGHAIDHLARLLDDLAGSLLFCPNLPPCIYKTDRERRRTGGKLVDAFKGFRNALETGGPYHDLPSQRWQHLVLEG